MVALGGGGRQCVGGVQAAAGGVGCSQGDSGWLRVV